MRQLLELQQEKLEIYLAAEKDYLKVAACLENWRIANGLSLKSASSILSREIQLVVQQKAEEILDIKQFSQSEAKY